MWDLDSLLEVSVFKQPPTVVRVLLVLFSVVDAPPVRFSCTGARFVVVVFQTDPERVFLVRELLCKITGV